jgi:hypothetical protein
MAAMIFMLLFQMWGGVAELYFLPWQKYSSSRSSLNIIAIRIVVHVHHNSSFSFHLRCLASLSPPRAASFNRCVVVTSSRTGTG